MNEFRWWNAWTILSVWFLISFNRPAGPSADEVAFTRTMAVAVGQTKGETALNIARALVGAPYVAGTLERPGPERLVVNLREFDCWTLVENVVALAETRHAAKPTFKSYQANLQRLRYADGVIDGYGSRHHYFWGWLLDHQQRGVLTMITDSLTAQPYPKKIGFMTGHRHLYPALHNEADFQRCARAEARINAQPFYFIPKAEVKKFENRIADGDLIGVTTVKDGLDVTHEGFAVRQNGRVYLLHASSEYHRVLVSAVPLAEYLAANRQQSGIVVARLVN